MCSRRSDSSWAMRVTGIPVHMETIWATSSSVTWGRAMSSCLWKPDSRRWIFSRTLLSLSRREAAFS